MASKLREELKKLAHDVPEVRAHVLPLLKQEQARVAAQPPKIVGGTLSITPEGVTMVIGYGTKGEGSGPSAVWKVFQRAMLQRKLIVQPYGDSGISFQIQKGAPAPAEEPVV